MKKQLKNFFLLITPFLLMVLINEIVRPTLHEKPFKIKGIEAINSNVISKNKCSWNCYLDTGYCKNNHVKSLQHYFKYIDPVYFGIIKSLHSTGSYSLANVFFLVLLLPFLIFFLLIKNLELHRQIKSLKSNS